MKITAINRIGLFAIVALLISSKVFAASDYLLEIEGIKGECKGKKFTLTENADGSFTATNIPAGIYKLIVVPAQGTNPDIPHLGVTKISAITMRFEGVVSPRDVATGQSSGKRQHKPFTITKELDKMSPKGSSLGEIVVGDLDGDGAVERGNVKNTNPPENAGRGRVNSTNPPENAGKAPVKAGYDLKLNKKV